MRKIRLTQGKFALVDDADYEYLNQWKWCFHRENKNLTYARRTNFKRKTVLMHRLIMDPPKDLFIDHINYNGLDNRRCNLRICTRSQNNINVLIRKDNTSGYKGVNWHKRTKKWIARISIKNKRLFLGYFKDKKGAAKAYDRAAKEHFGEFAHLNFKNSS